MQLFKSNCLPRLGLYYGLELCRFNKSQIDALQYVVTSCFGKISNTRSRNLIYDSMMFFNNCSKVSDILDKRRRRAVCPRQLSLLLLWCNIKHVASCDTTTSRHVVLHIEDIRRLKKRLQRQQQQQQHQLALQGKSMHMDVWTAYAFVSR